MNSHITRLQRSNFLKVHGDTLFVQPLFPSPEIEQSFSEIFVYGPCWAILDPGMAMETHSHDHGEFYVFTQGEGSMDLGGKRLPVREGMAINIPCNVDHGVSNPKINKEPLVWVSVSTVGSVVS